MLSLLAAIFFVSCDSNASHRSQGVETPQFIGDIRQLILSEVPIGTTRENLYRVLRSHSLVAYNGILRHYTEDRGGAMPIDSGNWPKAGQTPQPIHSRDLLPFFQDQRRNFNSKNPDAVVHYLWDLHWPCATEAFQRFVFDGRDRVRKIVKSDADRDCR